MDILYLLVPLSVVMLLGVLGVFAWALHSGQFDDLSHQARRILETGDAIEISQAAGAPVCKESVQALRHGPPARDGEPA